MNPATIIKQAKAEDVVLALTAAGTIRATSNGDAVNRWLPLIREHKPGILAVLKDAANEMFCFNPSGDHANDDEALQARVAIMMEGNGWDAATALQEARWAADRERCWRGFLLNAKRVLDAPVHERDVLLTRCQTEAARRYGQAAGANTACDLRVWVIARGFRARSPAF